MTEKIQSKVVVPLFPLPIAACPGEVIPLHIFEPRYRDLLAWCKEEQARQRSGEFAILFKCRGPMATVGCTVRLSAVLRTEEDGRSDILVTGVRRCRVKQVLELHHYESAEVEYVEDDAGDWDERLATEVYQLHRRLVLGITGKEPDDRLYEGKHLLSFVILPSSGMTAVEKQELLEMRSENGRLRAIRQHITELLSAVEYVQMTGRSIQAWCDLQDFLARWRNDGNHGS
ncbi:MAG TPA: LON peptidase substrate-binding domain-containing protein [Kiritimatiellia bacterium]|nr:LON peptidase substrate-binding domain-containing protein [Kiritimatiellia bacterium]